MRRLTLSLVAALTASVLAFPARAERDDAAAQKLGFQLGLQCWTYRMLTTFETMERCQKYGIKYLEMFPGQKMKPDAETKVGPGMSDEEIAALNEKAKSCGLTIGSFGVAGIPGDDAGARKMFTWAKKVGIGIIVTETTPNEKLDALAKEFGLKIAIHNHPNSWPADKVLEATKGLSKNVGACADTGHWLRAGKVPVENLKLLDGRIIESHFKDLNEGKADVVYGTGVANVKGMMEELKRQGFKGPLNMEYERGDLKHLDEAIPQCVAAFDKLCAEVAGH